MLIAMTKVRMRLKMANIA